MINYDETALFFCGWCGHQTTEKKNGTQIFMIAMINYDTGKS
jgi:hypothetical protein